MKADTQTSPQVEELTSLDNSVLPESHRRESLAASIAEACSDPDKKEILEIIIGQGDFIFHGEIRRNEGNAIHNQQLKWYQPMFLCGMTINDLDPVVSRQVKLDNVRMISTDEGSALNELIEAGIIATGRITYLSQYHDCCYLATELTRELTLEALDKSGSIDASKGDLSVADSLVLKIADKIIKEEAPYSHQVLKRIADQALQRRAVEPEGVAGVLLTDGALDQSSKERMQKTLDRLEAAQVIYKTLLGASASSNGNYFYSLTRPVGASTSQLAVSSMERYEEMKKMQYIISS